MHQLLQHPSVYCRRMSVCQDAAKIIESKLHDTQCGFRRRSKKNTFSHSSKFSRNPGNMPMTYTHVLSTSVMFMARFLVKGLGGYCGSTVLAGAHCWQSSNCIPAQTIVSVSTEVNHNRSALVLDSDNGVGCYPSPSLSGLSTTRLASYIRPVKPCHPAVIHFARNEKSYICEKCVNLVECNISRKNHITQDVRPFECCATAYMALWQICLRALVSGETSTLGQGDQIAVVGARVKTVKCMTSSCSFNLGTTFLQHSFPYKLRPNPRPPALC